jgi:hypothetical protein
MLRSTTISSVSLLVSLYYWPFFVFLGHIIRNRRSARVILAQGTVSCFPLLLLVKDDSLCKRTEEAWGLDFVLIISHVLLKRRGALFVIAGR